MDLSHNTSQRTIAHKQNVEEYVYFETIVQIGQEEYLIELAAERVKGQDKNLLDLYNVHVKRNPATAHLSTYGQGFSKDSITDKKGKIKAYFINFEGELKHTTNSEGKPIGGVEVTEEVDAFFREISGLNNDIGGEVLTQRGIKSGPAIVDNRGTFDPNEDNIYYQAAAMYRKKSKNLLEFKIFVEKNKDNKAALNKSYYTIEAQREVDVPFERIISEEFKLDNDSLLILEQALKKAQLDNINILDKSGQYKGYQVVGKISYGGKSFVITLEITTNGRIFLTKAKEATNRSEKSPAAMPTQSAVSNGQGKYSLAEIIDIVNKAESENKIKQSAKRVRLELEKEVVNQQGKRVKARLGKIEYLEWSGSASEQHQKGRALFASNYQNLNKIKNPYLK